MGTSLIVRHLTDLGSQLLQFYVQRGGAKTLLPWKRCLKKMGLPLWNWVSFRWSAWRPETLLKISRQLSAIKIQQAKSDNSDVQQVCSECFQCFLTNMLDYGNIFRTTIEECKDKLMVAIGQFRLLMVKAITGHSRFLMLTEPRQMYSGGQFKSLKPDIILSNHVMISSFWILQHDLRKCKTSKVLAKQQFAALYRNMSPRCNLTETPQWENECA